MTNEDIATKFYDDVESLKGHPCYHHLGTYSDGVYNGALDMGEWKDNQLKQLLSEHMEHATGLRLEAFMDLYRELFEQNAPEIPQATRLRGDSIEYNSTFQYRRRTLHPKGTLYELL
jgi:hypothetical protein